jgi:hypothetical protein
VARRTFLRHPGRVAIVVVGLLAVLNLGYFLSREQDSSEPSTDELPNAIERVDPTPGSQADRRIAVTADLRDDLTGVLVIDGQRIPEDQLEPSVPNPQGIVSFRPRPDQAFSSFEAGEHTVQVLYWKQTEDEPPDPDSYGWRFRATA